MYSTNISQNNTHFGLTILSVRAFTDITLLNFLICNCKKALLSRTCPHGGAAAGGGNLARKIGAGA